MIIHHQLHIFKLCLKINFISKITYTYIHVIYIYIKKIKFISKKHNICIRKSYISTYVRTYLYTISMTEI